MPQHGRQPLPGHHPEGRPGSPAMSAKSGDALLSIAYACQHWIHNTSIARVEVAGVVQTTATQHVST